MFGLCVFAIAITHVIGINNPSVYTDFLNFREISRRKAPLYMCKTDLDSGSLWQLPKPLDCKHEVTNETSELVSVTLWMPDITDQQIDAHECWMISHSRKTVTGFFYGMISRENNDERKPVSVEVCHGMILTGKSPAGELLTETDLPGVIGTQNPVEYKQKWWTTKVTNVNNYYLKKIKIAVGNFHDRIITAAPVVESCLYQAGNCSLRDGILVWTSKHVNKCRLVAAEASECVATGRRVSCPSISKTITDPQPYEYCDKITLGRTKQGLLFTTENESDIDSKLVLTPTSEVAEILDPLYLEEEDASRKNKKTRRSASVRHSEFFARYQTVQETAASLQYLSDVIMKNQIAVIELIHSEVCSVNQRALIDILGTGEKGFSSVMIRSLLNDKKLRGIMHGDSISVYSCHEVFNYGFDPLPNNMCIREFPVSYEIGMKEFHGFLRGQTHEIVDDPTVVPCPAPSFVFNYGDQNIFLANLTESINLPEIPFVKERHMNLTMDIPYVDVKPGRGVKMDELLQVRTWDYQQKYINDRAVIYNAMTRNDAPLTEEDYNLGSSLLGLITSPFRAYFSFIRGTGSIIVIVFVLIVICLIFSYCFPVLKLIFLPLNLCIKRLSVAVSDIERSQQQNFYEKHEMSNRYSYKQPKPVSVSYIAQNERLI